MMKKRMNKSLLMIGLSLLFILLLSACSQDEKPKTTDPKVDEESKEESGPKKGGKITIGIQNEPATLDMQKASGISAVIGDHFGAALLSSDFETGELKPDLAESYEVSEDGKTITFKLKPDITFHDGTPFNAQAYKDTIDRAIDPGTGSGATGSLLATVKEVTAPDELTLVIELAEPSPPFLLSVSQRSYVQPMSMAAIEQYGAEYDRNPVGVGPWKFAEWKTGQSISLVRNEEYKWASSLFKNKESAYLDEVEYKFITDYQTRLAALDSGSIDIVYFVEPQDVERYQENEEFNVVESERQGLGLFIEMNTENEKLQDLNLRKALNMAIDKEIIIQVAVDGKGTPANGPLSSNFFGYDPEVENYGYKYNQKEAIRLLEESGWSKNSKGIMEKDGEELELELLASGDEAQKAQIVQAMLKEIGVEIKIQSLESATIMEKSAEGDYELSFLSYTYNDPDILYMLFHSSQINGLNISRTNHPGLDKLLENGRVEMNLEKRAALYAKAQKIIVEEAYWIPLYTENIFHVVNKRVHDVIVSHSGLLFQDSWVD